MIAKRGKFWEKLLRKCETWSVKCETWSVTLWNARTTREYVATIVPDSRTECYVTFPCTACFKTLWNASSNLSYNAIVKRVVGKIAQYNRVFAHVRRAVEHRGIISAHARESVHMMFVPRGLWNSNLNLDMKVEWKSSFITLAMKLSQYWCLARPVTVGELRVFSCFLRFLRGKKKIIIN